MRCNASVCLGLLSAFTTMLPEGALADWHFSRWGDTVEETIARGKKWSVDFETIPSQKGGDDPVETTLAARLFAPKYNTLGRDFSVTLYFTKSDGKLDATVLCDPDGTSLDDYDRRMLLDALERQLGKPKGYILHVTPGLIKAQRLRGSGWSANATETGNWLDLPRNNTLTALLSMPSPIDGTVAKSCIAIEPLRERDAPEDVRLVSNQLRI